MDVFGQIGPSTLWDTTTTRRMLVKVPEHSLLSDLDPFERNTAASIITERFNEGEKK